MLRNLYEPPASEQYSPSPTPVVRGFKRIVAVTELLVGGLLFAVTLAQYYWTAIWLGITLTFQQGLLLGGWALTALAVVGVAISFRKGLNWPQLFLPGLAILFVYLAMSYE